MNNLDVGEKLRQMREASGLSAKEVSEKLLSEYGIDMNHRTLFNYEKGRSSPDVPRFLALCEIYRSTNILSDFGYNQAHDSGCGFEELVLFEDEYSPEDWALIKNFVGHIPTIKPV